MANMNVGSDPINPKYYNGTECAEIIEHMPANVAFAIKYVWRLGEKDSEHQEASKSIWYLKRQLNMDYRPFIGSMFLAFVQDRARPAYDAGKLDIDRFTIIYLCANYTIKANPEDLNKAISLFKKYLH